MQVDITFADGRVASVPVRIVPDRVLQAGQWRPGFMVLGDPFGTGFDIEAIEMAMGDGIVEGDDFIAPEDRTVGNGFEWKLEGSPDDYCRDGMRRWFAAGGVLEGAGNLNLDKAAFIAALPDELFGVSPDALFQEFNEDRRVWEFYLADMVAEYDTLREEAAGPCAPWLSSLRFEDVVTDEWVRHAFDRGNWDPEHGSDVWRWIDALCEDDLGPTFHVPPHLAEADLSDMLDDPEFHDLVMRWMRLRYDHAVRELLQEDLSHLGRRLTCDEDWTAGILQGSETLGVFFGTLPLDDGEFWTDPDKPVEVYAEVAVEPGVVDWIATIRARMDYVYGDEEREVRLLEESEVEILVLEADDREVREARGMKVSTGARRPRPTLAPAPL